MVNRIALFLRSSKDRVLLIDDTIFRYHDSHMILKRHRLAIYSLSIADVDSLDYSIEFHDRIINITESSSTYNFNFLYWPIISLYSLIEVYLLMAILYNTLFFISILQFNNLFNIKHHIDNLSL